MKKVFLNCMLLLCALIVGSSSVWADDASFSYSDFKGQGASGSGGNLTGATKGEITITGKGNGNNSYLQVYSSNYLVVTPSSGATITSIVLTATSGYIKTWSASDKSTVSISGDVATWSGTSTSAITLTNTASAQARITSIVVTYSSSDSRLSPELAWSAVSVNITYNNTPYVLPTLTNNHGLALTYASSNTSAATINSTTGVISIKNFTGTTTISASFVGDETYKPQTVSYTLNVTKIFIKEDGVFDFVEAAATSENYGSDISTTTENSHYETTDATWTAGNVTMETSGKYRWWDNDGTLRFYSNTPKSIITLSVPDNKIITRVTFTGGNSFTPSSGSLSSGTWTGVANSVSFEYNATSGSINVKKITIVYTDATLARTTEGYSTFYTPCKVEFTSSGSLKVYKGVLDGTTMNLYQYSNNVIPENIAVILKSDADITVAASSSEAGTADGGESSLIGTLTPKDASTVTSGTLCVLGQHEGTSGFYAFTGETLAANKAYLVIPTASAPSIHFVINEENNATSIEAISATDKAVKFIDNGRILIKKNGITYDALGRIVE